MPGNVLQSTKAFGGLIGGRYQQDDGVYRSVVETVEFNPALRKGECRHQVSDRGVADVRYREAVADSRGSEFLTRQNLLNDGIPVGRVNDAFR